MRVNPKALKVACQFHGSRGLARRRRAGQQYNAVVVEPVRKMARQLFNLGVVPAALLENEAAGVLPDPLVYFVYIQIAYFNISFHRK